MQKSRREKELWAKVELKRRVRDDSIALIKRQFAQTPVCYPSFALPYHSFAFQADVRAKIHVLSVEQLAAALKSGKYTCVQALHAYQEAALNVRCKSEPNETKHAGT